MIIIIIFTRLFLLYFFIYIYMYIIIQIYNIYFHSFHQLVKN